jgi:pimeloyl-ACP methyl ester carboxylesterase
VIARIHDDSASDRPALVYVPGIDGTGEFLFETAGRLAQRFRLLRLAYGLDGPAGEDDYGRLAESIARRLDEAGVERALLLAESFGVGLALRVALDHPARVAGLVLVNGFAHFRRRVNLACTIAVARSCPEPLFRLGRHLFAPRALLGPRWNPDVVRVFRALAREGFDEGYRRRLTMIRELDLRPRLGEIEVPVALFASDRDRVVDAVRANRLMLERLPDARLEILERAGHVVLPLAEEPWVERAVTLAARAGIEA